MTAPQESRAMDVDDELASLAIVPRTVFPHLDALGEKAKDYARNARSQNTQRAYESDWRRFSSWLRRQGLPALPPNPQTVGLYLAACADGTGRITAMSVASLERRLSGIAWHYRQLGQPLDAQDRHIATVLAGIRRAHGRPPVQKEAMLETWMRLGRIADGPLFRRVAKKNKGVASERLTDKHVARLVQKTALAAGIRGDLSEGERKLAFSGHSLRAGLASSAKIEEAHIQRHLGHASAEMTRRYQSKRDRFRVNLTKAAGL